MAEPVLIIATTAEVAARRAAEEFARTAQHAARARGRALMALSGGTTVVPVLRALAAPPLVDFVPWDATDIFWSDERCVGADDPASNHGTAMRELLSRVAAPPERIHAPSVGAGSPEQIAARYEQELLGLAGKGSVPRFDLILLGMGTDGHTASLFPGSGAIRDNSSLVVATRAPTAPRERISFGPALLLSAARVLVLVTGPFKAQIVYDVLAGGTVDPVRYPTQLLGDAGGDVLWYLDRASASALPLPPSSNAGGAIRW